MMAGPDRTLPAGKSIPRDGRDGAISPLYLSPATAAAPLEAGSQDHPVSCAVDKLYAHLPRADMRHSMSRIAGR